MRRKTIISAISIATLIIAGCTSPINDVATTNDSSSKKVSMNSKFDVKNVLPLSPFHSLQGPTCDDENNLYVGSLLGSSIYKVNPENGDYELFVPPPKGQSDDMEFSPVNGQLYWTSMFAGEINTLLPDGTVKTVASGLYGVNPIAFTDDGRLFTSLGYKGDKLYEIDPEGIVPPRMVRDGVRGLNGFDIGPDGMLYGPLQYNNKVVRIDIDTGEMSVVADGFGIPGAVNFDSQGNLYLSDAGNSILYRIDYQTGEYEAVVDMEFMNDNIAIDSNDRIYGTNFVLGAVYEFYPETGERREIIKIDGSLTCPGGLALYESDDDDISELHMADVWTHRVFNPDTMEETGKYMFVLDQLESSYCTFVNEDHLIISGWGSSSVQKRDRVTGEVIATYHGFGAPYGVVEMEDETIIVVDSKTGELVQLLDDTEENRQVVFSGLIDPTDIKLYDDMLYVSEVTTGNIIMIDPEDWSSEVVVSGLSQPEGFDFAPDGALIVAEVGKKQITAIDIEKDKRKVLIDDLNIGLEMLGGPLPMMMTGVVVSKNYEIYFSSDLDNTLYKLTKKNK